MADYQMGLGVRPPGEIPFVGRADTLADLRRRVGAWILVFQRGGISGKAGWKSGQHAASDPSTPICGSGRRASAIEIAPSGKLTVFGNGGPLPQRLLGAREQSGHSVIPTLPIVTARRFEEVHIRSTFTQLLYESFIHRK